MGIFGSAEKANVAPEKVEQSFAPKKKNVSVSRLEELIAEANRTGTPLADLIKKEAESTAQRTSHGATLDEIRAALPERLAQIEKDVNDPNLSDLRGKEVTFTETDDESGEVKEHTAKVARMYYDYMNLSWMLSLEKPNSANRGAKKLEYCTPV